MYHDRIRFVSLLIMSALLVPTLAGPLSAQKAELIREENFRLEPNGGMLAVLSRGTSLEVLQRRQSWIEAVMEGWVWAQSLQATDRGGFNLVVSLAEGENLRSAPQGGVLARLAEGTLLDEVERIPGWIRVRRRGWIWAASVQVQEAPTATPATSTTESSGGAAESSPPPSSRAGGSGATPQTRGEAATEPPASSAPPGGTTVLRARTPIFLLSGPSGDTVSSVRPGTQLSIVRREGDWVRVQVEGWVLQPTDAPSAATEVVVQALDPERVAADPTRMRGQVVSWELQFVSLERAEAVRTDFREGEPFLLMRTVGDGPARFVYVAIPEERVADVQRFAPLERLTVQGRVRSGASALTGSPVLDLIDMTRRR